MTTDAGAAASTPGGPLNPTPPGSIPVWHTATQQAYDRLPYWMMDRVRCVLPGVADHPVGERRRSEFKASNSQEREPAFCQYQAAMQGDVWGNLGAAAMETPNWHYLAQLIGPNYDGTWSGGPAVALSVRDGYWQVEGGKIGDTLNPRWFQKVTPYVDKTTVHVELDVQLSEDPLVGRVTGTIDSVPFERTCRTYWHNHVIWSHGIYRGSGNTPNIQPDYTQSVDWRLTRLGVSAPVAI